MCIEKSSAFCHIAISRVFSLNFSAEAQIRETFFRMFMMKTTSWQKPTTIFWHINYDQLFLQKVLIHWIVKTIIQRQRTKNLKNFKMITRCKRKNSFNLRIRQIKFRIIFQIIHRKMDTQLLIYCLIVTHSNCALIMKQH